LAELLGFRSRMQRTFLGKRVGRGEDYVTLGRVRSVDRNGFQLMMHFCNYHFSSLCPIIRDVGAELSGALLKAPNSG
jgi:hypothetical protein